MNKGKIMRKLLGQHPATTSETVETTPSSPQLRPTSSQNTVFKTRASIACLDRSPDGQRAVIAGQKVFKTLKVDGSTITEDVDLRAIISSYAASHDPSAATADQLNIRAVKWSYHSLDTTIITACGNGRIALYDLNRAEGGLEYARIQEHARQVHKLAINPFKCNWLLSASQDGTIKSFDLRAPFVGRNGPTFRTWNTFKCNADAVRDVKWSPTDGLEFACSTDAGVVQKWDMRKPSAPILKITAHQSACFSISWHPDGNHLVSGGMDQHCHVWNVSKTAERGQKPRYSFTTPAPVSTVSWRPACWSATANGNRSAQVTVVYDDVKQSQTSAVHLWDLARPGMPFKEIEQWDSSPTGILWNNSRDILWSADKEGHFTQTDVAFVPQLIERRSLSTFAFSPTGDVLMLLEERQAPRRPRPSLNSPEVSPSYQHVSMVPQLSVSRSDSEEDVVGSFLGPRKWKKKRRREPSQLLSTTPPGNGTIDNKVMSLDDSVMVTGLYKPQQIMAIGHAPSTAKRETYKYFTNHYLKRMDKVFPSTASELESLDERVASAMEHFAATAESVAHYRLAQTWRLLAYAIGIMLLRRAEFHRTSRLRMKRPLSKSSAANHFKESPTATPRTAGEETPRRFPRATSPYESPLKPATKSLVSEDVESTSNVATPLVRPMHDSVFHDTKKPVPTSFIEDDILHLPDAAHSPRSKPHPIPGAPSSQSSDQTTSSIEGYDFYGIESFSPAIDFVAPPKKQPLRLDYSENSEVAQRIQPKRHDSGESFAMFSTSGDSQPGKYLDSFGSDDPDPTRPSSLRDRVSTWESSFSTKSHHRESIDSNAHTMSTESSDEHPIPSSFEAHRSTQKDGAQKTPKPPVFRIQEASFRSAVDTRQAVATPEEPISPLSASNSTDPHILESDYLPWKDDPDFVFMPLDPATLVQRAIMFETQTGALNASAMILLLQPLLPIGAIDNIQASAILAQYHSRLTSMQLFTEATMLRNLCVPVYPNVFAMAQERVKTGFFCTDCRKPLENDPTIPESQWQCPRCDQAIAGCAICHQQDADKVKYNDKDKIPNVLWWYCPGCGHGGHTMCISAWHGEGDGMNPSNGCCPMEGCLHPCLPGQWRETRAEEKKAAKQRELDSMVKENSRHGSVRGRGVRPDAREVNQSKAVEGVRVALGITGLERKKNVKIVVPGEQSK